MPVAALVAYAQPAAETALKSGWTEPELAGFAAACSTTIMVPARRDYDAKSAKSGHPNPAPFPEAAMQASIGPMCSCLARRVASIWALADFPRADAAAFKPLVDEALSGGRWRPGGLLGEMLQRARAPGAS